MSYTSPIQMMEQLIKMAVHARQHRLTRSFDMLVETMTILGEETGTTDEILYRHRQYLDDKLIPLEERRSNALRNKPRRH